MFPLFCTFVIDSFDKEVVELEFSFPLWHDSLHLNFSCQNNALTLAYIFIDFTNCRVARVYSR